jgi:hypothetical protein
MMGSQFPTPAVSCGPVRLYDLGTVRRYRALRDGRPPPAPPSAIELVPASRAAAVLGISPATFRRRLRAARAAQDEGVGA